jgi:hypothetical protein
MCLTESGSGDFSGSAVDSRDIPGNRILSSANIVSRIGSSWLRLNAAEPAPRSAV